MAQTRLIISLALFLLFGATTAPLFAMEPTNPSGQRVDTYEQPIDLLNPPTPRDIRKAEENRRKIAAMHQRVDEMLEKTEPISSQNIEEMLTQAQLTNQEAEETLARANPPLERAEGLIKRGEKRLYPDAHEPELPSTLILNPAFDHAAIDNSNNPEAAVGEVNKQKPASPEFPALGTMNNGLDAFLQVEEPHTNLFGDYAANETPANSEPIEVTQVPMGFPNQPRFVPNSDQVPSQATPGAPDITSTTEVPSQPQEPSIPAGPTIPLQSQENPAPAQATEYFSDQVLYDDMNYYLAATAGQHPIPGKGPQQSAPLHPQPPMEQPKQVAPAQQARPEHPVEVQKQPETHRIEESMLKQILDNIMEHKVPMATAGAFGVVHYLYENEILANAIPVRSRNMCIFLHDFVLPTTREALAANLIQLLLPYLPYLRDKGVRSYSSGNYLASFVTTKLLGTTALYLAKLVTQTEQGKKLITQYKRLPKKTKETIEKVVPWLNFARNVLVARSLAGYFE